jgi:hypothetical protein
MLHRGDVSKIPNLLHTSGVRGFPCLYDAQFPNHSDWLPTRGDSGVYKAPKSPIVGQDGEGAELEAGQCRPRADPKRGVPDRHRARPSRRLIRFPSVSVPILSVSSSYLFIQCRSRRPRRPPW